MLYPLSYEDLAEEEGFEPSLPCSKGMCAAVTPLLNGAEAEGIEPPSPCRPARFKRVSSTNRTASLEP